MAVKTKTSTRNKREMLILCSASPRRKELIKLLKVPYMIFPVDINENIPARRPSGLVKRLALMKASAGAKSFRQGTALGADTIVVNRGRIIGKPKDYNDAKKILAGLSNTTHKVYTGVALVDCADPNRVLVDYEVSRTRIRKLSGEEIAALADKHPDKAGAYAVQEKGDRIVEKIYGDYTNVVGLPVPKLKKMLAAFLKQPKSRKAERQK